MSRPIDIKSRQTNERQLPPVQFCLYTFDSPCGHNMACTECYDAMLQSTLSVFKCHWHTCPVCFHDAPGCVTVHLVHTTSAQLRESVYRSGRPYSQRVKELTRNRMQTELALLQDELRRKREHDRQLVHYGDMAEKQLLANDNDQFLMIESCCL